MHRIRSDNESGYCDEHTYEGNRPSMAKRCGECGTKVRFDNKSGFCKKHEFRKNRPSVQPRFCKKSGCGKQLAPSTKSTTEYCPVHYHMSEIRKKSIKEWNDNHPQSGAARQQPYRDKMRKAVKELERARAGRKRAGRKRGDRDGERVYQLESQGLKGKEIKKILDRETGLYRSIRGYQMQRDRYLARRDDPS